MAGFLSCMSTGRQDAVNLYCALPDIPSSVMISFLVALDRQDVAANSELQLDRHLTQDVVCILKAAFLPSMPTGSMGEGHHGQTRAMLMFRQAGLRALMKTARVRETTGQLAQTTRLVDQLLQLISISNLFDRRSLVFDALDG